MTIRTSSWNPRFLFGDAALYDDLVERLRPRSRGDARDGFRRRQLKERDASVAKAGASRYLVDPT